MSTVFLEQTTLGSPSNLSSPRNERSRPSPLSQLSLLWSQLVEKLRPPRRIRPTRPGLAFIGLTLFIGFAALNTGNNLLYVVLGMMLSLIGVSGILSEFTMRGLSVRRTIVGDVTAGRDTTVTLRIKNHKRFLPAISIWVEERGSHDVESAPGHLVHVPARGEVAAKCIYRFTRRGVQRLPRVRVSTTYPFGLFRRAYPRIVVDEYLVYPPIELVSPGPNNAPERRGETPFAVKGRGEEFFGLRAYSSGDDPRRIHWKSSAKRGTLLIRENSAQQHQRIRVQLELDNPLPEESTYERGLVHVVSYAAYYLKRGFQVGIDIPGGLVPYDVETVQLRRILRAAALAPRAGEAAELPPSSVRWPPGRIVRIRVTGQVLSVEDPV